MYSARNKMLSAAVALLVFASCQKEVDESQAPETPGTDTTTNAGDPNLIKDTTLAYSQDIYLWYEQIPETFNPRSYDDPEAIMTAIRQYSNEPGFTKPVDRWSFAAKKDVWDGVSSGVAGDFGLNVFFLDPSDLRVKSVEAASSAGLAGIHRGWRITKINGSSNITTGNVDYIVENVFNKKASSFTFEKPDGSTVDLTLNASAYQENPLYKDSTYSVGGKKIGYLSFNSFLGDTTQVYNDFERIFAKFAAQQVSEMVIDLRYNGGGYVSVQEKLANYLAPLAANGNLMMKQAFNDKLAADFNSTSNFVKKGSLNLSRIFFIVSENTASASELLINNLKPYVDVKLVGPSKTYGKPVGFFPVPVGDWYIFPVSFRTTNKNNEGSYFDGLALNKKVADGLDKDWGDLEESCLASVVNYISTGVFLGKAGPQTRTENSEVTKGNTVLAKPEFKGTIDTRGLHL